MLRQPNRPENHPLSGVTTAVARILAVIAQEIWSGNSGETEPVLVDILAARRRAVKVFLGGDDGGEIVTVAGRGVCVGPAIPAGGIADRAVLVEADLELYVPLSALARILKVGAPPMEADDGPAIGLEIVHHDRTVCAMHGEIISTGFHVWRLRPLGLDMLQRRRVHRRSEIDCRGMGSQNEQER